MAKTAEKIQTILLSFIYHILKLNQQLKAHPKSYIKYPWC